ncbi:hypothetical protein ABW21_db0201424 [Orbilia brochopaga]|nr:hypothetical protein ABW21_db0201424 [Drechslerella brochopaga]
MLSPMGRFALVLASQLCCEEPATWKWETLQPHASNHKSTERAYKYERCLFFIRRCHELLCQDGIITRQAGSMLRLPRTRRYRQHTRPLAQSHAYHRHRPRADANIRVGKKKHDKQVKDTCRVLCTFVLVVYLPVGCGVWVLLYKNMQAHSCFGSDAPIFGFKVELDQVQAS